MEKSNWKMVSMFTGASIIRIAAGTLLIKWLWPEFTIDRAILISLLVDHLDLGAQVGVLNLDAAKFQKNVYDSIIQLCEGFGVVTDILTRRHVPESETHPES